MPSLPKLAITMGDPAGIGPEIIVAGWSEIMRLNSCRPLVLGHSEILRRAAALRNLKIDVEEIDNADSAAALASPQCIPCWNVVDAEVLEVVPGRVDPRAGKAVYEAIVFGIDLALKKAVDGIVTAPIHKEALNLAGYHYPGHTELLAEKCGTSDFAMMLYLGPGENLAGKYGLAVDHVTLHTAMRNVFEEIRLETVLAKARLLDRFMSKIKGGRPSIGVCSLNPHAGENGLFGDEEIRIIRPAVEEARKEGLDIEGPFPADTIMVQAKNGRFDAVVAMFHDQGHIALKLLGMHRAVNITLGLPIIRTSVAHGTAFDRAGQGTADPGSMIEAVRVAAKLAEN